MKVNWDPQSYAKHSKSQELWAKELIKKVHFVGNETVLDIGCGDGKVTDYLAHLTTSYVVGIDLNSDMIALAKASYSLPHFQEMDAEKIEYSDTFDIVFSNAALHWVKNHEAVMEGIYKALKPQGKMIVQMGGEGNARVVFAALENVKNRFSSYFEEVFFPYTFCSDRYYEEILHKIGFVNHHAVLIPKEMVHEGIDAFQGWLKTTWFPYLERVPESMREEFLSQWTSEYLGMVPPDKEGNIHVSMVRLEAMAQKL